MLYLQAILGIVIGFGWIPTLTGGNCEGTTLVDTYGYALLEESQMLPDITLRSVTIKFCLKRTLQIWEKTTSPILYTLRWKQDFFPKTLETDLVANINTSNLIRLQPDIHRLGLYVPDKRDLPIFAQWGIPQKDRFRTFYSQHEGKFNVNSDYGFMTDLINPISFNVTLCGQPDCGAAILVPTTTNVAMTTVPAPVASRTDPSAAGCDASRGQSEGRAFVDVRRVLPGGTLRGIRIRPCILQPYLLQVWEELDGTQSHYRLVWHKWIIPKASDGSLQIVLFRVEQYLSSRPSYRAGIQLDPFISLAFAASPRKGDLRESAVVKDFNLCEPISFRGTDFTWDLNIDFCITTDCSPSNEIERFIPRMKEPCPEMFPSLTKNMISTTTRLTLLLSTTTHESKPKVVTSPTTMMTSTTAKMTSPTTMMTMMISLPTEAMFGSQTAKTSLMIQSTTGMSQGARTMMHSVTKNKMHSTMKMMQPTKKMMHLTKAMMPSTTPMTRAMLDITRSSVPTKAASSNVQSETSTQTSVMMPVQRQSLSGVITSTTNRMFSGMAEATRMTSKGTSSLTSNPTMIANRPTLMETTSAIMTRTSATSRKATMRKTVPNRRRLTTATMTQRPTILKTTPMSRKVVKTTQSQNTIIKRPTPRVAAASGKGGVSRLNFTSFSQCVVILTSLWQTSCLSGMLFN